MHVDLPNYLEKEDEVSEEERNRRMRERGVKPARPWNERPIILSSVSRLFSYNEPLDKSADFNEICFFFIFNDLLDQWNI